MQLTDIMNKLLIISVIGRFRICHFGIMDKHDMLILFGLMF